MNPLEASDLAAQDFRHQVYNGGNIAGLVQRLAAAGAAGVVLFAHEANWEVSLDRLHWTTRWELTTAS